MTHLTFTQIVPLTQDGDGTVRVTGSRVTLDTIVSAFKRGNTAEQIQDSFPLGDWAWMRNHLQITITRPDGTLTRRSGYVLTILRKNPEGAWVIARDANLLTEG